MRIKLFAIAAVLAFSAAELRAQGFVLLTGDDADDFGHCSGVGGCGGLFPNAIADAVGNSGNGGAPTDIIAVGVNSSSALNNLNAWSNGGAGSAASILGAAVTITHARTVAEIAAINFANYKLLYVPSNSINTGGGINNTQLAALNGRAADIANFVNNLNGSLIALTEAGSVGAWGWLPLPLTTANASFTGAAVTADMAAISPGTTSANLSHCCFHNVFTGPLLVDGTYAGLRVLATATNAPGNLNGRPVYLGSRQTIIRTEDCSDGRDNDNDGLIDNDDPDCQVCGDGDIDPGEDCDDGNNVDGDGCDRDCNSEAPSDSDPPTCAITGFSAGPPTQVQATVQDTGSGIDTIQVLVLENAVASWTQSPAQTTPIVITATKIDQSKRARILFRVTDVAGNFVDCDPYIVNLDVPAGETYEEVLDDVPDFEGWITIYNKVPGFQSLEFDVNGDVYNIDGLASYETHSFQVFDSLYPGNENVIKIRSADGLGGVGTVFIAETPGALPSDSLGLFERGDTNVDGTMDLSDPVSTLNYLFSGTATLLCEDAADANDDGFVDLSDAIHSLNFLYTGVTDTLPQPYGACGVDGTSDTLTCSSYPECL